jgi:hypothetical protein
VTLAALNRDLVPGRWSERHEIFNEKGEVVVRNTVEVAIDRAPSGAVVRLIQSTSDSLDTTEQRRLAFDQEADSYNLKDDVYNPFRPSAAGGVAARKDGRTRRIGDTRCICYTYDQRTDSGAWSGTAWLEEKTGVPVEVSVRKLGLPEMEGFDEVREHILNIRYRATPEGDWYPVRIIRHKQGTLGTFPYNAFPATQQTSIGLGEYWKIRFQ